MKNLFMSLSLLLLAAFAVQAQDYDKKLDEINNAILENKLDVALEECKTIIAATDADSSQIAIANSFAAIACEQQNRIPEAIAYYKTALEMHVPRLDMYDRMIMVTKNAGDDENYEFALLEKRKAFPDFAEGVTQSLAYHYSKTKQYEKLIEASDEMLVYYPNEEKYLNYKAKSYNKLKQSDSALVYYKKVLDINPENPSANMAAGMELYKKGSDMFKRSKAKYEAIKTPSRVDYTNYKKSLDQGKAVYAEALPYLLKAYQSDDKYSSLKPVLHAIYTRLDNKVEAEKYKD